MFHRRNEGFDKGFAPAPREDPLADAKPMELAAVNLKIGLKRCDLDPATRFQDAVHTLDNETSGAAEREDRTSSNTRDI